MIPKPISAEAERTEELSRQFLDTVTKSQTRRILDITLRVLEAVETCEERKTC